MSNAFRTVQRRVLRYFRRHDLLDGSTTDDMLTWRGTGGFSIDASVRIEGDDRHGLERLVRYCARPPYSLHRLHAMGGNATLTSPDARLLYRLPGPTPDGRSVPSSYLPWSCSSAWRGSSLHHACTGIATTESLRRTLGYVPR